MVKTDTMLGEKICFLCIGYGFKLAPVYGKVLCELAFDLVHSFDLGPYRADRLQTEAQKNSL